MAGLVVPKNTLKQAERFLDACETGGGKGANRLATGRRLRLHGRQRRNDHHDLGGLAVPQVQRRQSPQPRPAGRRAAAEGVSARQAGYIYYLYYATQVMHHMQGESWRFWNDGVDENGKKNPQRHPRQPHLQAGQGTTPKHPHQIGSWPGSPGGRIMATSLSLLCLEVYYRHLPLYRRDMNFTKENK